MRLIRPSHWQILIGALLGLALWNPAVPWRKGAGDLIVLLDDSLSMARSDGARVWASVSEAAGRLSPGSRLALVRFAAQPVLEMPLGPVETLLADTDTAGPLWRQPLDRSETRRAKALEFSLRLVDPQRPTALVMITDGRGVQEQDHAALTQVKSAGIPVYGRAPPAAGGASAWIAGMEVPTRARIGQRVPVDVSVTGQITTRGELHLELAGKLITSEPIDLHSGGTSTLRLWLEPAAVGPQLVRVALRIGDSVEVSDTRSAIVNVGGPAGVLYVAAQMETSAVLKSLRAGGWPVTALRPEQFLQARLRDRQVVILDNVSIGDMPRQAWENLGQAVTREGLGLVVLGGDRSFGAGAYRHSSLERLLPVTAQASKPEPPAAVLFVVDQSGSMDQGHNGINRLRLARQAVRETARMLPGGDQVGLLTFAVEPRQSTPLGLYEQPVSALESGWRGTASGGTRLLPALQSAVNELQRADVAQRLLVLVTDGFIDNEAFDGIERQLAVAGIDVIALVIGSDADLSILDRLTGINNGRLLQIHEVAELPLLMQQQVGKQRNAIALELTRPREITRLPFGSFTAWPPLDGHLVTKARPEATVYLQANRGDPLLAAWQAGTGRVVALPGGLGDWAAAWHGWSHWGRFLGGLIEWCNPYAGGIALRLQPREDPDGLAFIIDALDDDQDWAGAKAPTLWLTDPAGQTRRLTVEPIAPGRYHAHARTYRRGGYRATVQLGAQTLQQETWIDAADELSGPAGASSWADWLAQGLVRPLPTTGLRFAAPFDKPRPLHLRPLLLILAALAFMAQLADERGLLTSFAERFVRARWLSRPVFRRWLKLPQDAA